MATSLRLPENQSSVKFPVDRSESPSLVIYGNSGTWNRQQKRCYHRLRSFFSLTIGRKCQLLRVDLTTSGSGDPGKLREHLKELLKRVKRRWGYDVVYFCVETSEGGGVLHMIWAIEGEKAVWIDQAWLSEEWEKIHGAKIVYIKRIDQRGGSAGRISKYFVSQYFAGQKALVRISWSWWKLHFAIVGVWKTFKSEIIKGMNISTWMGRSPFNETLEYRDLIQGWEQLLKKGYVTVCNVMFFMSGKTLDIVYR